MAELEDHEIDYIISICDSFDQEDYEDYEEYVQELLDATLTGDEETDEEIRAVVYEYAT